MARAVIRIPERARKGEVIEVSAIIAHPMETGFRSDSVGKPIARHIVETFSCTYNGEQVFRAKLFPAIAANPYLVFFVSAVASGELVFTWTDDRGASHTETRRIEVQ
jgi:sulfur-oxidizing protein SoxZ